MAGYTGGKRKCDGQGGTSISSLHPKRLPVPKDTEKALAATDHRVEVLVKEFKTKVEASIADGGRWFPVDANNALVRAVLPTPTATDKA